MPLYTTLHAPCPIFSFMMYFPMVLNAVNFEVEMRFVTISVRKFLKSGYSRDNSLNLALLSRHRLISVSASTCVLLRAPVNTAISPTISPALRRAIGCKELFCYKFTIHEPLRMIYRPSPSPPFFINLSPALIFWNVRQCNNGSIDSCGIELKRFVLRRKSRSEGVIRLPCLRATAWKASGWALCLWNSIPIR